MLFANNCNTTLNGGITAIATSMVVTSATGFPVPTGSQYFYCTLADAATQTTIEIVKVTAVSGTTFTIVRGQDGTTGTIFASGAVVSLRLVRANLNDFPKLDEDNTFTGTITFSTPLVATNMVQSSTSSNGYLSSTDWTTFNNKAPAVTYTTGYVPFGQGTTTPTQDSGFFWDNTNKRLGVNTPSPTVNLDVTGNGRLTGSITVGTASTVADLIAKANVSNGGAGYSEVLFANNSTNTRGYISYFHNVDAMTFATTGAEAMRISASGGVSIGNTTDAGAGNLSVNNNIFLGTSATVAGEIFSLKTSGTYGSLATNTSTATWYPYVFQTNSVTVGYIAATNLATVYSTTSDRRLKTNILPLTNSGTFIDSMLPRTYTWINGNVKSSGFIADELQTICPTAVVGEPNQLDSNDNPIYQGIDASDPTIIANIVAELQSIRARLKAANIE